jgi:indole-3-glycerol phosphate synthase
MSSILTRIFEAERADLSQRRAQVSPSELSRQSAALPLARDFAAALRSHEPAIIAEVKRASPSKGDILPGLDPAAVARDYAASGAAAISVLTNRHFKGSLDDLRAVRAAVDLPLLRKDFTFDDYQLLEARVAGADAILLIVAMLAQDQLKDLLRAARELGLSSLVEVHNRDEFLRAEQAGAGLIGINNRDLHTFITTIATTEELLKDYSGKALVVAESGIETAEDVRRLHRAGARGFLIGESLLRDGHPGPALSRLTNATRNTIR